MSSNVEMPERMIWQCIPTKNKNDSAVENVRKVPHTSHASSANPGSRRRRLLMRVTKKSTA